MEAPGVPLPWKPQISESNLQRPNRCHDMSLSKGPTACPAHLTNCAGKLIECTPSHILMQAFSILSSSLFFYFRNQGTEAQILCL